MTNFNNGAEFLPKNNPANAESRTAGQPARQDELPPGLLEKIRAQAASLRNTTAFTQAIGVLMRSPHYRYHTIGDL